MNPSTSSKLSKFVKSDGFLERESHYKRMIALSEKIYGRRKDLELTQAVLAKKAGTTQRIISELEHGIYAPDKGIGEDLYDKLSEALVIDRDYLFSEKIERKTFELFSYIGKKLKWKWDIMQFMKLPYFVDLLAVKDLGFQISNFSYYRWDYGPFDKKIYTYRELFENKKYDVNFLYIDDFLAKIDEALKPLPINDGERLKELSYETPPLKKLKATMGGAEGWGKYLDMTCS